MLKLFKIGLFLAVVMAAFMAGVFFGVPTYADSIPDFSLWREQTPLTSYVYDRYGNEIATLYGEQNRIFVPLQEIPLHVQQAFIAIEDERFYSHIGIDPIAIARSLFENLKSRQWAEQGGSTITQQLVKNTYLSSEKTIARKLREAWFSLLMERKFSKDEILEMYLNTIYFAHGAYGIEAAANYYFDKSTQELTLAEGALLAGIPRRPRPPGNLQQAYRPACLPGKRAAARAVLPFLGDRALGLFTAPPFRADGRALEGRGRPGAGGQLSNAP